MSQPKTLEAKVIYRSNHSQLAMISIMKFGGIWERLGLEVSRMDLEHRAIPAEEQLLDGQCFRDTNEVVIDVTVIKRVFRPNEREIMARELIEDFTLGTHRAPDLDQGALQCEKAIRILRRGACEQPILESVDVVVDFVRNRKITVHDQIGDGVKQGKPK